MQAWNLLHAARWNTGRKNSQKYRHLGTIAQLCRAILDYIFAIEASTIGKNLLSSHIFSTCLHNMVHFGPLAAEIGPVLWGTPPNFNSFLVLAALLHGILVVGVSQTLRLWIVRGRHLYSAGRPSPWSLGIGTHSSLFIYLFFSSFFLA